MRPCSDHAHSARQCECSGLLKMDIDVPCTLYSKRHHLHFLAPTSPLSKLVYDWNLCFHVSRIGHERCSKSAKGFMPKLYDAGRHFRAFISCTTDDCIALVTFLSPIFSKLHEHMNQCAHKSYLNYILNFSFEDRFSPKTPKVFGLLLLLSLYGRCSEGMRFGRSDSFSTSIFAPVIQVA